MAVGHNLNNKALFFLKYLGIFCLFFIANMAGINEIIYPFAFGLFFAFMWCNQNVFVLLFLFVLSGVLSTFSHFLLISNLIFCLIFLIIYGIHYKLKKPFKHLHILVYACICNFPKIFMEIIINNSNIYYVFVELFVGLMFTFACIKFFECLCVRGITSRLTSLEVVCAFCLIAALCCGLCGINIKDFSFVKFFVAILLLFVGYICNLQTMLIVSSACGVGCLVFNNMPNFLCLFILYGLVISAFKTKNKYITVLSLIATECLCMCYFKLFIHFNVVGVLPIILACFIYLVVPNKYINKYCNQFNQSFCNLTEQSVINQNRELLYIRLVELSDVFAEMSKVYKTMIGGGLQESDAKKLLICEIKEKNCKSCSNVGRCFRAFYEETFGALTIMVDAGFSKGKINLLDVPTLFAGKCERLNTLVGCINDLIGQYKNYAGLVGNIDASKILLSEQMGGISEIMKDLSKEINKGVCFEKGKEKKIIDELTYNNIICSDALVFQDPKQILSVALSVRNDDSLNGLIAKVVSRVCRHNMEVVNDVSSSRSGFRVLTLKSASKYDVVFGIATKTKTGSVKSGDSYSVIKIKDGKYLFAICDGMGSGERAEAISGMALGLLENFYKAGFDKEIILSSVNKLLSLGKDDVFSALDLCVVDATSGTGDFIKMGAPESFVKHKETTDVVKMEALPLGIIQNAQPKSKQVYFSSGDKIVLCSDGVVDGFNNFNELKDFINNLQNVSPQTMADLIIEKVLTINKNVAKDDMTIIVAKIFEK